MDKEEVADGIASYTVLLAKGDRNKFGIAYRVLDNIGVVITGVIPNSPADEWNSSCDSNHTICAGDTIIDANQSTEPRPIVEELLNSVQIYLHVQKTGPRWHITGEGAVKDGFKAKGKTHTFSGSGGPKGVSSSTRDLSKDDEVPVADLPLGIGSWFLILLAVFIPNLLLIGAFSDIGVGIKVFTALAAPERNFQGNILVGLGSMLVVVLIVSDWVTWKSKMKKALSGGTAVYIICVGAMLKCRYYPFTPLVIITFHIPVFLGVLRSKILPNVRRKSFYVGVTLSSFLCAFFALVIWLLWMNVDSLDGSNRWDDATKTRLVIDSEQMYDDYKVEINGRERSLNFFWDCDSDMQQLVDYVSLDCFQYDKCPYVASNYTISVEEEEVRSSACARVKTIWFLAWTCPLMSTGIMAIISIFTLLNGVLLNVTDTSKLEKVLKQFILMISFLVFTMYVSSSVAACALIGANVLIPSFLLINMLNQFVRKRRGLASKDEGKYTVGAQRVISAIQNWNWASILIKANWLVMLYWTLSVGVAKLTYVFLSWLNEELLKISFVMVLVIFFIIGFTMFMLPPVPGIPVYICAGIVLSARARNIEVVGKFWGGMCIAILESLVLKICAVCGQYSIGYYLGKSVKVQQMVSVDKVPIRAIEQILSLRGLNLPKVSVLVGGPDWPTSVLCGILRINLLQCCIGTLPVIFVSTPCVVAGAFMSNPALETEDSRRLSGVTTPAPTDKEGEIWDTLSTTALAGSFLVQLAGMVLALYFIQEVVHRDGEELAKPRKEHEAVAALTRREADYVQEYPGI
eukprot:CAMPEP_0169178254 /NCGR_PEP_ID=MMETSP1015-20121227/66961_1 /TAXON_ID=342587 /ORGANISM="Karlodinium micrum, Strain CCMP2283" /LENGTH=800 /DNA_ID=CAMNT_0009253127 /DNA_START=56 /DNA_END=2458 /DNA_ORIENTATION=+